MTTDVPHTHAATRERLLLPRFVWREADGARWLAAGAAAVLLLGKLFSVAGVPRTSTMAPLYSAGLVTPTCGLTRSITAIASGQFALAWRFNPGGFLVVALVAGLLARWVFGRLAHRWLTVVVQDWRVPVGFITALTVALWVNQRMNADFVMNGRL